MLTTGTVLITLDDIVAISKSGQYEIAKRLMHQMLDTRVSAAVNEARASGRALVARHDEWYKLAVVLGDGLPEIIEDHIYPTAEEIIDFRWSADKNRFWVIYTANDNSPADLVLTYSEAGR